MDNNERFVLASSVIENEAVAPKERKNATIKNNSLCLNGVYHENYY